ncbi:carbohydrate ABC transporter permease [Dictyobacter arantiisoli]|uniref:Sugar ABC transporter permease n=1 Tax=Dictyobacter arantiisoli TaxID=2014874 RepID=A0A5A5TIY1_9CHLR|nr:sugar ABC transporter permease [Dictyobacter arantiisoli]GCF11571.1 sugar ABC transporter permease [Dictyobacter arantiisoli]
MVSPVSSPPDVPAERSPRRSQTLRHTRRVRALVADLFLLPYLVFLLLFGLLPGMLALILSFSSFENGTPNYFAAGLHNFVLVFTDFRFRSALANITQFLIISVPLGIAGVVALSLLLHTRTGWFADLMRTIYFLPGAVAGPTSVLIALFIFDPQVSPFRGLLNVLGYQQLVDVIQPGHLPLLFTLLGFFAGAGGWIAILYGGLKGIPIDIIEAAQIDGANAWQAALYIKLPAIRRYIIYLFIITFAGNIQLFTEPQLIGASFSYVGIATISPTWSPNQLGYFFAFTDGNFGAAAAMSLLMVAVGLAGAILVISLTGFFSTDVSPN